MSWVVVTGEVLEVLFSVCFLLLAYRVVGKPAGQDPKYDAAIRFWSGTFTVLGVLGITVFVLRTNMELWMILTASAAIVAATASVVIASRLARILEVLGQINAALTPFGTNLAGLATVICSQEEAIKTSSEAEEEGAVRMLLEDERPA